MSIIIALWLVAVECDHSRLPLGQFDTKDEAMEVASLTFNGLSDDTKAHCEINVSQREGKAQ